MEIQTFIKDCENQLTAQFNLADEISEYNQEKVLKAFKNKSLALRHFNPTTGYGYGDEGRYLLGEVL